MIRIKSLILFILVFAILSSCSVSKRKYMSGYHVEWNHPAIDNYQSSLKKVTQRALPSEKIVSPSSIPDLKTPVASNTVITYSSNSACKINKKIIDHKLIPPTPIAATNIPDRVVAEKKTYWKAIVSLLLGLLLIFLPIGLTTIGYAIFYPGASDAYLGTYIAAAAILWFICALIAFIEGIQALKYIKKNSDKYEGRGDAIAGIVLSSIVLAIFSIILIGIAATTI